MFKWFLFPLRFLSTGFYQLHRIAWHCGILISEDLLQKHWHATSGFRICWSFPLGIVAMAKWSNAIKVGHGFWKKAEGPNATFKWSHQINTHQICFMSPIWAHEHMHLVDAKQLLSLCKTGKLCEALPPAHGGDAYLSPSWSGQNWSRYQGEE